MSAPSADISSGAAHASLPSDDLTVEVQCQGTEGASSTHAVRLPVRGGNVLPSIDFSSPASSRGEKDMIVEKICRSISDLQAEVKEQREAVEQMSTPTAVAKRSAWWGCVINISLVFSQIFTSSGHIIGIGLAEQQHAKNPFLLSSAVFMSSVIIMTVLVVQIVVTRHPLVFSLQMTYVGLFIGFLFAAAEGLVSLAVVKAGGTTTSLVLLSRVIFAALGRTCLLSAPITELHCQGIGLLLVSTAGFFLSTASPDDNVSSSASDSVIGIIIGAAGAFCHAFATVFMEQVFKDERFSDISKLMKNFYIQNGKLLFMAVYMLIKEPEVLQVGLFHEWSFTAVLVAVFIAMRTISTILVVDYLDALAVAISNIVSTIAIYGYEVVVLNAASNPVIFCFVLLVLQSVFVFCRIKRKLDKYAMRQRNSDVAKWIGTLESVESSFGKINLTLDEVKQSSSRSLSSRNTTSPRPTLLRRRQGKSVTLPALKTRASAIEQRTAIDDIACKANDVSSSRL